MKNDGHRPPAKFSAFGLIRRGLSGEAWPPAWRRHDLRASYDVVVVGAGVHGLATAYYLAENHGITNVAVVDKGYVGGGGSGGGVHVQFSELDAANSGADAFRRRIDLPTL